MIRKFIFFSKVLIFLVFLFSCEIKNKQNEQPIAEVGNKKLYLSDIENYLQNMSSQDSLTVLTDYVNRWAKNQVVLSEAENNLSENEMDVSRELEDYKTSLLIHKYEQLYIGKTMDTAVSDAEIEKFYKENSDNFQLSGVLVKALYIKVYNDFQHIDKIRQLYRSTKEKDIEELEKIAMQGAVAYESFNSQWIDLNEITATFPGTADSYENRAIRMKYIEDSDDKYTYFLKIHDVSTKGAVAPLEHVKSNIKTIILNRRKTNLIRQMENSVFSDAMNKNKIKINI
ncbi:MAG: peptidyl-prolyl cis-trans isomerase [Prevotellaceae bacterium]|jgi:hypothetical protein|nr:peptidyl-prolyl cis-trans isomerase [Prevotellaceae bacterium]